MIHPRCEARHTGTAVGLGGFATAPILKGTIVYVMDKLEIVLPPERALLDESPYSQTVRRYAYRSPDGCWIISWDDGKYVNHSCQSNTLNTGYGFEIAVRDILPGEEVTDDYGMLNISHRMPCLFGVPECRGIVCPNDFDRHHARWDGIVREALADALQVDQPLWSLLDRGIKADVRQYCQDGAAYRTVRLQQCAPPAGGSAETIDRPSRQRRLSAQTADAR